MRRHHTLIALGDADTGRHLDIFSALLFVFTAAPVSVAQLKNAATDALAHLIERFQSRFHFSAGIDNGELFTAIAEGFAPLSPTA